MHHCITFESPIAAFNIRLLVSLLSIRAICVALLNSDDFLKTQ
jgi:hypothetical protein